MTVPQSREFRPIIASISPLIFHYFVRDFAFDPIVKNNSIDRDFSGTVLMRFILTMNVISIFLVSFSKIYLFIWNDDTFARIRIKKIIF